MSADSADTYDVIYTVEVAMMLSLFPRPFWSQMFFCGTGAAAMLYILYQITIKYKISVKEYMFTKKKYNIYLHTEYVCTKYVGI